MKKKLVLLFLFPSVLMPLSIFTQVIPNLATPPGHKVYTPSPNIRAHHTQRSAYTSRSVQRAYHPSYHTSRPSPSYSPPPPPPEYSSVPRNPQVLSAPDPQNVYIYSQPNNSITKNRIAIRQKLENLLGININIGAGDSGPGGKLFSRLFQEDLTAQMTDVGFFYEFRVHQIFAMRMAVNYMQSAIIVTNAIYDTANNFTFAFNSEFGFRFYLGSPVYLGTGFGLQLVGVNPQKNATYFDFGAAFYFSVGGLITIRENYFFDLGVKMSFLTSKSAFSKQIAAVYGAGSTSMTADIAIHLGFVFRL